MNEDDLKFPFDEDDLNELMEHFSDWSREQLVQQYFQSLIEIADLKKQRDYLYEHARINVRDIDPDRNLKIEDWVKRGVSDAAISKYLVKTVSPKVVKNIRTSLGIKKPKGRPKKT